MAKKKAAKASSGKDVSEGMACAILAYILIGIIWFFVDDKMKKNKFVKFHVKQALVLLVVSIILSIIGAILTSIYVALFFTGGIVAAAGGLGFLGGLGSLGGLRGLG